jgi:integrase
MSEHGKKRYPRFKTKYPGIFFREVKRIGGKGLEKIYYAVYKKGGHLYEERVGREYADAMTPARAALVRGELVEGKRKSRKQIRNELQAQKEAEADRWTIDRLWNEYQKSLKNDKSRKIDAGRYRNYLKTKFGSREPHDLIAIELERLKRTLSTQRSPQTVKHVMTLLERIVNFGKKSNLCRGLDFHVKKPTVNNEKTEFLTEDQLKRLAQAIAADDNLQVANFMRMALLTGMRRSELFKLKWGDIDFDHNIIVIRDPKNGGNDEKIPLNNVVRKLLENHDHSDSPYVFPGKKGKQRTAINIQVNRIKSRAELPKDFRPLHGLRHTYASLLASSGKVDMYVLQKLMTHKTPRMTQRYAHLRDDTLKRAADLAGELVSEQTLDALINTR